MSLTELDAFLAHARSQGDLLARLQDETSPLELSDFLQLAQTEGFAVNESDVIDAQQRQESLLSDAELQRRAGMEARRLRHFLHG
jgi:predicted ribosomally synthesized peptide with nif11-like leader